MKDLPWPKRLTTIRAALAKMVLEHPEFTLKVIPKRAGTSGVGGPRRFASSVG